MLWITMMSFRHGPLMDHTSWLAFPAATPRGRQLLVCESLHQLRTGVNTGRAVSRCRWIYIQLAVAMYIVWVTPVRVVGACLVRGQRPNAVRCPHGYGVHCLGLAVSLNDEPYLRVG